MKLAELLHLVAEAFDVSAEDVIGAKRVHDLVAVRDAFAELAILHTRHGKGTIARAVAVSTNMICDGHKRSFPQRMKRDPAFASRFTALEAEVARIAAAEREGHSIRSNFFNQKRQIEKGYSHG